ncbi:hypothetical protein QTI66_30600 [Variovorax sp. J22R133]|uniref:hypothetical protein n=1 Tax=Variovorax brevis TaxID=3053503 RepID=UPI00257722A2|nr:hypothetical protein [Variovorax sp. J22R133]MDM0116499.1 hypothetical protein [Variovorax sp. J22R133]
MSFKQKIGAFVEKHGYTYRAYVLGILFFPPAAVFIACKKPDISMTSRVTLNVFAIALPPLIGAGTLYILKTIVDWLRIQF